MNLKAGQDSLKMVNDRECGAQRHKPTLTMVQCYWTQTATQQLFFENVPKWATPCMPGWCSQRNMDLKTPPDRQSGQRIFEADRRCAGDHRDWCGETQVMKPNSELWQEAISSICVFKLHPLSVSNTYIQPPFFSIYLFLLFSITSLHVVCTRQGLWVSERLCLRLNLLRLVLWGGSSLRLSVLWEQKSEDGNL